MSNWASFLSTGMPADSSERTKHIGLLVNSYCLIAFLFALVLAAAPSWPLAFGVAFVCAVLAYVAYLVLACTPRGSG